MVVSSGSVGVTTSKVNGQGTSISVHPPPGAAGTPEISVTLPEGTMPEEALPEENMATVAGDLHPYG
jgi:hypothetical protein